MNLTTTLHFLGLNLVLKMIGIGGTSHSDKTICLEMAMLRDSHVPYVCHQFIIYHIHIFLNLIQKILAAMMGICGYCVFCFRSLELVGGLATPLKNMSSSIEVMT